MASEDFIMKDLHNLNHRKWSRFPGWAGKNLYPQGLISTSYLELKLILFTLNSIGNWKLIIEAFLSIEITEIDRL